MHIPKFLSSVCLDGLEAMELWQSRKHLAPTFCPLNTLSNKSNQDSWGKQSIPGLGWGKCKMSLEHLIESENKEVFQKPCGYRKNVGSNLNGQSWNNCGTKVNNNNNTGF